MKKVLCYRQQRSNWNEAQDVFFCFDIVRVRCETLWVRRKYAQSQYVFEIIPCCWPFVCYPRDAIWFSWPESVCWDEFPTAPDTQHQRCRRTCDGNWLWKAGNHGSFLRKIRRKKCHSFIFASTLLLCPSIYFSTVLMPLFFWGCLMDYSITSTRMISNTMLWNAFLLDRRSRSNLTRVFSNVRQTIHSLMRQVRPMWNLVRYSCQWWSSPAQSPAELCRRSNAELLLPLEIFLAGVLPFSYLMRMLCTYFTTYARGLLSWSRRIIATVPRRKLRTDGNWGGIKAAGKSNAFSLGFIFSGTVSAHCLQKTGLK